LVVFHPGSGSDKKNWPLENWIDIGNGLLGLDDFQGSLIIVSGEADDDQVRSLRAIWKNERVQFAKHFPLPELAAIFEHAVFIGHDSGISHLAAAASADCILLFGPSDPEAWAPLNENVQVIRGADGKIDNIEVAAVEEAMAPLVGRDRRARPSAGIGNLIEVDGPTARL
jgi:heptosyltransferase-2